MNSDFREIMLFPNPNNFCYFATERKIVNWVWKNGRSKITSHGWRGIKNYTNLRDVIYGRTVKKRNVLPEIGSAIESLTAKLRSWQTRKILEFISVERFDLYIWIFFFIKVVSTTTTTTCFYSSSTDTTTLTPLS